MPILSLFFSSVFLGAVIGFSIKIFHGMIISIMWPINVPVMIQRGDSVVWDMNERGKIVKNKAGYEVLRLKNRKKNIKPPKFAHVTLNSKGKPVYPIYNTALGQFFPVGLVNGPSDKNKRLELVEDASSKNWGIVEYKRISDTYRERESALMKYLPYIMSGTFAAMVIFFIIYYGSKMEGVSNSLAGATNSLTKVLESTGAGKTQTPPTTPSSPATPSIPVVP